MKIYGLSIEYGLSFVEGKRVVRYPSREKAEAQQVDYPNSVLVQRFVGDWTPATELSGSEELKLVAENTSYTPDDAWHDWKMGK